MSYHVFFAFSVGLKESIWAPRGTLEGIWRHIEHVEKTLELTPTRYRANNAHWQHPRGGWVDIERGLLCKTVREHNDWVRRFYDDLALWAKSPVEGGDEITPRIADAFWHGLEILSVPPARWDKDYYRNRMEHLYEVMRGNTHEGVTFDAPKLTPKQAGAVINLFSFLDPDDLRLDVPKGCDYLASLHYGEYEWCSRCGAVENDYAANCRRRGCDVQANWCEEDRPEWFREAKGRKS